MKYYRLNTNIERITEKAYGIVTGTNGAVTPQNIKLYLSWIPKSQTKKANNNIYIPQWLVNANNFYSIVDKNDIIEDDIKPKKRKRRTKEQIEKDEYQERLLDYFHGEIPNKYIVLEYEDYDGDIDRRFFWIEKLEKIKEREELKKIIIVEDGKESIYKEF